MGKKNHKAASAARRCARKAKRAQRAKTHESASPYRDGIRTEHDIFGEVVCSWRATFGALVMGDAARARLMVDSLCLLQNQSGTSVVGDVLELELLEALRDLWKSGWQPVELVRQVRRKHKSAHDELVAAAIIAQSCEYLEPAPGARRFESAEWVDQLDTLAERFELHESVPKPGFVTSWVRQTVIDDPGAYLVGAETVVALRALPEIPIVGECPGARKPANSRHHVGLPIKLVDKVQALLAKAEATEFEQEADALTQKAQELMSRHSIDAALLAACSDGPDRETPTQQRILVDDPYSAGKSLLLQVVAQANRCRTAWWEPFGFTMVAGFQCDIEIAELLYGSLLVQATMAMLAHGSIRDEFGRVSTTSFRKSFVVSFANRIGDRLAESVDAAVDAVSSEVDDQSGLLPVLASREGEVRSFAEQHFGNLKSSSLTVTNHRGLVAGTIAANTADLTILNEMAPQSD